MTKKVLYIVPHRLNRSPGQRFRCEHFISFLEQNGFEITYSKLLSEWDDKYFYQSGKYLFKLLIFVKAYCRRFRDLFRVKKYDSVFIYREALMIGSTFFERAIKKTGVPIIYDFDDSIWIPDTSEGNQNLSWMKRPEKTNEICELSQMVIVGNAYLAEHASKHAQNVRVIPTTIDTNYHAPEERTPSDKITIGWTGTETTHKHFTFLEPTLEKLQAKYGDKVQFIHISNKEYIAPNLDMQSLKWSAETEIENLLKIDIGIMPLPNDNWAKGKCGFKGLQYMSLEIPTVMSPVGVNTEIIEHGENGFLAESADEWITVLSSLIENADLRKTIGKAGRQTIITNYSVESQKEKYLELFREVVASKKL